MTKEQLNQVRTRFLADVAGHEVTILRDDGVHRHVRFLSPKGSEHWFDLITWPGRLCIDGDMGTYVFSRLPDMFEFFRAKPELIEAWGADGLFIDEAYWAGKLISTDRMGVTRYDPELFRACVKQDFEGWCEAHEPTEALRTDLWEAIEDEVLSVEDYDEHSAREAASEFSHPGCSLRFEDFWEHDLRAWTLHYVWCCYAIAWGIQRYDDAKKGVAA